MMTVKSNVREYRNRLGWTQAILARAADTSQQKLQRWEHGQVPKKAELVRLCAVFD